MKSTLKCFAAVVCFASFAISNCFAAGPTKVIDLWPNGAPGEKGNFGEEKNTNKPTDQLIAGKPVIRLGNVSQPTISIYRPPADKDTGASVVVFPGGGYYILAMDLEGTEVCDWLNSIGVTGMLLKYRVPKREGLEKHTARCRTRSERWDWFGSTQKSGGSIRNASVCSAFLRGPSGGRAEQQP